jgi:hypothetical protein
MILASKKSPQLLLGKLHLHAQPSQPLPEVPTHQSVCEVYPIATLQHVSVQATPGFCKLTTDHYRCIQNHKILLKQILKYDTYSINFQGIL